MRSLSSEIKSLITISFECTLIIETNGRVLSNFLLSVSVAGSVSYPYFVVQWDSQTFYS